MNITEKLIKSHLVSGEMIPGKEIAIKIDQTLTQDSTGTMAYLQFEAIGIPRVKTENLLHILTTTHCRQALKTPMTTNISRQLPKTRYLFLQTWQRHLPSGTSGTFRQTRQNIAGF